MKRFERIYCIIKLSEWDYHHADSERSTRFERLSPDKKEQIKESDINQKSFLESLKGLSQKIGLKINFVEEADLNDISPDAKDLIIASGGDGTFLTCAQVYPNSVLLGMNSDYLPKAGAGSYGALTSTTRVNLEDRLSSLMGGRFFVDQWPRLQAEVNGQLIDRYAVNDIYYGSHIAYRTCDLHIEQCGQEQDFNCSGVLCCTGMGSHAWHQNAGGSPFSNELDAFGFRVLFPNIKRPLSFTSGVISHRHELTIIPERDGYVLSFDSKPDVIETEVGDEIKISIAHNKALRVVSFFNES